MRRFTIITITLAALWLLPQESVAQCEMTLPYSMNFEGLSTGGSSFVPCWTRVDSCISGTGVYPNVYSYGSSYGNVLNFNGNGMSTSGTMRAATPRIPAPLNQLELSFNVLKSDLYVYGATDPTDPTTYHLIGSYSPGYIWGSYAWAAKAVRYAAS